MKNPILTTTWDAPYMYMLMFLYLRMRKANLESRIETLYAYSMQ